jgi:hypothetical protein
MTKIIKLTEAQLRDVVTRAINEQKASPNASPAAKQVWTKLSIASSNGGAGGTDEVALVSAISMITSVQLFVEVDNMMRGASSIGNYKSIVKLLNGELEMDNLKQFQQIQAALKKAGVTLTAQTEKNSRSISGIVLKPGTIRIVPGKTPAPTPTPPVTTDPTKPTYRACKGFPLMYGCKQTEVGYVQQCLGLKVDYSFGPATLQALVSYAPMSKGSTPEGLKKQYATIGLSKQEFDLIRTKYCKAKPKPKPKPGEKPVEKPVVDTRTPMADTAPLKAKELKMVSPDLGINSEEIRARLIKQLQASAPPEISQDRKDFIIGNIKNRGFDQKYVGDNLSPVEQNWVDGYMKQKYGSVVDKNKTRGGDTQIRRFDTPQG